jgi:hypothetical protein
MDLRFGRALLAGLALSACAPAPSPNAPAAVDASARAGIAIDPAPRWPDVRPRAESRDALIALKPSFGADDARRAVTAFFDALATRNRDALARAVTDDAFALFANGGNVEHLDAHWGRRLTLFDYAAHSGDDLWDTARFEVYRLDEARAAGVAIVAASESGPQGMQQVAADDLIVRVVPRPHGDALRPRFGRELWMVVVSTPEGPRIRRTREDFVVGP